MRVNPAFQEAVAATGTVRPDAALARTTGASFARTLATTTGTSGSNTAPTTTTDPSTEPAAGSSSKKEETRKVEGKPYEEILSGKRNGMFINRTGNERDGQAFVLVKREGRDVHIYGSGEDRKIIVVWHDGKSHKNDDDKKTDKTDKTDKPSNDSSHTATTGGTAAAAETT